MKTPPLLLAAAIGFWGWQSNQVMVAALLALALESPRVISARHVFTQKNLNRASDLCALVCLLMAVYFFAVHRSARAIFMTVQWLPVAFFPLALIQGYHTTDRLNVSGFFMVIRRKYPDGRPSGPFVNFSYPYLALCILGASTANISNQTFYAGLALLTGAALWGGAGGPVCTLRLGRGPVGGHMCRLCRAYRAASPAIIDRGQGHGVVYGFHSRGA